MKIKHEFFKHFKNEVKIECDFIDQIESDCILILELIGKLVYLNHIESNDKTDIGDEEVELIMEGLHLKFPTLTKGEIDLMSFGFFHCYHAKVGIGPENEQEAISNKETAGISKIINKISSHKMKLDLRVEKIFKEYNGQ